MNLVNDLLVLYSTWFKPHAGNTHQQRLENFYRDQAGAYDSFRQGLLHGRRPMQAALAARLEDSEDLVWVDMGGGTGYNVELMEEFIDLSIFKEIYVVDLCPSLCQQARARVERKGWTNVKVVEGDVCQFQLEGDAKADVVTFSYSLSMIPPFHDAVDQALTILKPSPSSVFAVTDFYTSEKFDLPNRQHGFATRTFWRTFFELDGIYLGPERRQYLDHRLDIDYEFNDTGSIPYLPFMRPPFYVVIGHPKGPESKRLSEREHPKEVDHSWSLPSTFIYSMTWEDPREDAKYFKMGPEDVVLSLTSGGCNLFDMLLDGKLVVGVDLNPAQNHLVELKAVAIRQLSYDDFWLMFGEGIHPRIDEIFLRHLSPHLTRDARQFWAKRLHYFKNGLYLYGAMGWNVFLMKILSKFGLQGSFEALLKADTLEEQTAIWDSQVRWKLSAVSKLVDNPYWLWMFNGVPKNQLDMILEETTIHGYLCRVFDQAVRNTLLKNDNYFYRVCLTGKYTKDCCPRYLEKENFLRLKNEKLVDKLVLRTDTFQNVLKDGRYSKIILMDHMDWLNEEEVREFSKDLAKHVVEGGQLIWRSASTKPWYAKFIQDHSFEVKKISDASAYMDRVNMYASFYTAYRATDQDPGYGSDE